METKLMKIDRSMIFNVNWNWMSITNIKLLNCLYMEKWTITVIPQKNRNQISFLLVYWIYLRNRSWNFRLMKFRWNDIVPLILCIKKFWGLLSIKDESMNIYQINGINGSFQKTAGMEIKQCIHNLCPIFWI